MSLIKKCSCKNDFQDKKYGKGRRVFTTSGSSSDSRAKGRNRCTVCGKEA